MSFEELEHTADILMKITSSDFAGLFAESGFALAKTLYGDYPTEQSIAEFAITADGKDSLELIVNFLSELLFLSETEYLVPMQFHLTVSERKVSGTVDGVFFDRKKHAGGIGVKGISYSGIQLTESSDGAELRIIFDI